MTKYCKRCDQTLSVDQFTKASKRYDGLQSYCSDCMKKYRIEHYKTNKQAHYDRNKKTQAILRDFVLSIKNNPCMDCGIGYPDEPWLMEFDHRDSKIKKNIISYFVSNGSMDRLVKELDKCDLLCLVCHRRRTAKRGNWIDNRLSYMLE